MIGESLIVKPSVMRDTL